VTAQPEENTTGARSGRPWWFLRPDAKVTALSLGLGAATIAAHAALLRDGLPSLDWEVAPVWVVLLLMFAATDGFAIHLRVRRGGHAMSLSEIPMVLGVLGTDPTLLVLARVLGGGAGLAFLRRQRGVKLRFNLVLLGVQATVAVLMYRALAGPSDTLGPRQWLAAYAAMLVTDMLADILITAAISLHDDPGEWRRLPAAMRGVPLVAVTTSIALVSVLAVEHDVRAVVLLGVVSLVAYVAYRAYVRQSQGHAQVEGLYAFTRALDGSLGTGEVTRVVLDQARDQLRAEVAELMLPGDDGRFIRTRMTGHGDVETTRHGGATADAWWAAAANGQPVVLKTNSDNGRRDTSEHPTDGMAVPVPMGDAAAGVLIVTDSLPDLSTFGENHVRLFQALANHASVSLARAGLVDRLRQEVSEKEHLALHDPLTGLPNRRQLLRRLETALGAHESPAGMTAVMLMDLDRFKEVNDALGHDIGDALLREVGARLQRRLGSSGVVARLGGDEFAVLLSRVRSEEEAIATGYDLTRALEYPVQVGHLTLNPRASVGIALAPRHGDDATTLLQRADVAMYAAKTTGSGVRVYHPEDDQNTPDRLALIADLREAIQRRDLVVAYQPMLDPASGLITGAEALARWHHPDRGFIPPDEFIPLAEHAGLIRPLTLHVLETALRRCAAWRRIGHDLHVAVNLSPSSLLDGTLPEVVNRMLGQIGVPARALTLEITESSIMTDPRGSRMTLDRMNALGVRLAIDDFGTGYSSLGRLRELPIHAVKIDKSFVQRIAVDGRDRAVVRSAVQLGHALDLEVVAEGIEDRDTYAHLAREGCNLVQGYYVSKPLPADEFVRWLSERVALDENVIHPQFGT